MRYESNETHILFKYSKRKHESLKKKCKEARKRFIKAHHKSDSLNDSNGYDSHGKRIGANREAFEERRKALDAYIDADRQLKEYEENENASY